MKVATFEGFVENGQIRLSGSIHLPEKAKVYVVVPGPPRAGSRFLEGGRRGRAECRRMTPRFSVLRHP